MRFPLLLYIMVVLSTTHRGAAFHSRLRLVANNFKTNPSSPSSSSPSLPSSPSSPSSYYSSIVVYGSALNNEPASSSFYDLIMNQLLITVSAISSCTSAAVYVYYNLNHDSTLVGNSNNGNKNNNDNHQVYATSDDNKNMELLCQYNPTIGSVYGSISSDGKVSNIIVDTPIAHGMKQYGILRICYDENNENDMIVRRKLVLESSASCIGSIMTMESDRLAKEEVVFKLQNERKSIISQSSSALFTARTLVKMLEKRLPKLDEVGHETIDNILVQMDSVLNVVYDANMNGGSVTSTNDISNSDKLESNGRDILYRNYDEDDDINDGYSTISTSTTTSTTTTESSSIIEADIFDVDANYAVRPYNINDNKNRKSFFSNNGNSELLGEMNSSNSSSSGGVNPNVLLKSTTPALNKREIRRLIPAEFWSAAKEEVHFTLNNDTDSNDDYSSNDDEAKKAAQ